MNGYNLEVFVHSYLYYGGIAFLYVNKTNQRTYVEDLELELENLENHLLCEGNKIHIEVLP